MRTSRVYTKSSSGGGCLEIYMMGMTGQLKLSRRVVQINMVLPEMQPSATDLAFTFLY